MTTTARFSFRRLFRRRGGDSATAPAQPRAASDLPVTSLPAGDPLAIYLQSVGGPVEIDALKLDSPALRDLKGQGVKVVVPLINQGEFVGIVALGERLSDQGYASDDLRLLGNIAAQSAPAFRVANLVSQQRREAAERERIEQELRVARLVQQTLLPREALRLDGWKIEAVYAPARAVGGDFYDFIKLADGRVTFIIGDVTDKGVPAALVMAMTRTLLREACKQFTSPAAILTAANEGIVGDIPPKMFVTCFVAIVDPASGRLVYANAGHDVPYMRCADGVQELRARGMPLGLMEGMSYGEKEVTVNAGDTVLLYTDGLVEAHSPDRSMFGFPRLKTLISAHAGGPAMAPFLLENRAEFTGPNWEPEDDTTMIILQRCAPAQVFHEDRALKAGGEGWRMLDAFDVPSEPGKERGIADRVAEAVAPLQLPAPRVARLKTAVAEAAMNAIEHGNQNDPARQVHVVVKVSEAQLAVHVADEGGAADVPEPAVPDLDAKLAGLQSPRGWGLFLIQKMVDEMNVSAGNGRRTVELIVNL